MAEHTYNASSPACEEWERHLAEAMDGLVDAGSEAAFAHHRSLCTGCAEQYEEARRGREWLAFLAQAPEPPAGLLEKILARTGPGQTAELGVAVGNDVVPMPPAFIPAWQRPGLAGSLRRFAEPRLMMTAAMAFFSIAMTINMTGVHLSRLRPDALRSLPSVARSFLERRLTMASTPIIRYYDHSRLVYEVQAGIRELRRSAEGAGEQQRREPAPGVSKQAPGRNHNHNNSAPRTEAPLQAVEPDVEADAELNVVAALDDSRFLETSLTHQAQPALSGGSRKEIRKRGTIWTA